ncbi:hypothetical protein [Nocardia gamkensis]|uniref:hypothetical protein n=1 Tax=Nocardia gamkensis TaxID=352869 RepID=UPI0037C9CF3C
MIGKWFRKNVAKKLAHEVFPDAARAAEKPIRQIEEPLEFAGKTVPDRDLEGRDQIRQSGCGESSQGTPAPLNPSPRSSAEFSPGANSRFEEAKDSVQSDGRGDEAVGSRFEMFPMSRDYETENSPLRSERFRMRYLTADERKEFELRIVDGKLHDARGNLYDTTNATVAGIPIDEAMFVMDGNGIIYSSVPRIGKFQHSSFLAGGPVAAAGQIRVRDGVLEKISNHSGHYKLTWPEFEQTIAHLRSLGVPMDGVEFEIMSKDN